MASQGYYAVSISSTVSVSLGTVFKYIGEWRQRLRKEGAEVPLCRCGEPHAHLHYCAEKRRQRPPIPRPMPEDFATYAPGISIRRLARRYRACPYTIKRWLEERPDIARWKMPSRALRERKVARGGVADTLYDRIDRCVPTGYAPDVREDMISDLYVAILSGKLAPEDLVSNGRRFINRTLDECGASQFSRMVEFDRLSEIAAITSNGEV